MKVQELMSTNVESIAPHSSLRTAARKMRDLNVGTLPVVLDGQILGILTDRDISCFSVAIGRDPQSTEVQKVMVTDVSTCYDDDDIDVAAKTMADHHIRRLAVLHRDNSLAGILSVDDLARGSHELAGAVLEAAQLTH